MPLHNFAFLTDPEEPSGPNDHPHLGRDFRLAEVVLESRYARDENLVQSENRRRAIGLKKWPVFTFRLTMGANRLLGSNFKYQKYNFLVTHSVSTGQLGRLNYRLGGQLHSQRRAVPHSQNPARQPNSVYQLQRLQPDELLRVRDRPFGVVAAGAAL